MINVDSYYSSGINLLTNKATSSSNAESFSEILAQQTTDGLEKTTALSNSLLTKQNIWQTNNVIEHEEEPTEETATDKFLAEMKKTPSERLREQILKSLGLTEEDLESMTPEERKAVETQIAQMIKNQINEGTGNKNDESKEEASSATTSSNNIVNNEVVGSQHSDDNTSDKNRNMEFAFVENLFRNQMDNLDKYNKGEELL